MDTFYGILQDPEGATQIVPVGMIGKRTIKIPKRKENQKRNLILLVTTQKQNHHMNLHLHQLRYPYTKKNSNGLQNIANLEPFHQI